MAIEFKRIILPRTNSKARVFIYGLAHGMAGVAGLQQEVLHALEREVAGFHSNDYVLAEGFHAEHELTLIPEAAGVSAEERTRLDYIGGVLKTNFPGLLERAERAEPFFHLVEGMSDRHNFREQSVAQATLEAQEQPEQVELVRARTSLSVEDVAATKQVVIKSLLKAVPAATPAEVKLFVEATTTFRSLLMARAAFHRAMARRTSVRLFCGFLHAEEATRFLERPKFLNEYLRNLSREFPLLSQAYQLFEHVHETTTRLFQTNSRKVPPQHHTQLLQWIAHKTQLHALTQVRERKSTRFSIDLAEFKPRTQGNA